MENCQDEHSFRSTQTEIAGLPRPCTTPSRSSGTGTQYAKSARSAWEDNGALVTALLAHTHGAGRWFIARHDAFLRTVVLSASPAAWVCVDDLMQDVYVHLWRDDFHVLRQWQREHPLQAYLRTVVTRLVWDRLNRLQPVWEELEADPWMAAGADLNNRTYRRRLRSRSLPTSSPE